MVFKFCCCRSLLSRAASMCQLHHFCKQLLDRCQSILLLGPATMRLAKATLICMPAISVAGMLLSFQLFSLSWKLLKWTKQCFVHSVAMLHVTTFAKKPIWFVVERLASLNPCRQLVSMYCDLALRLLVTIWYGIIAIERHDFEWCEWSIILIEPLDRLSRLIGVIECNHTCDQLF